MLTMISKNTIKKINSLQNKKFRKELGLFIAEGEKLVEEIIDSDMVVESIFHTTEWHCDKNIKNFKIEEISHSEMKKISGLTTPSSVIAVVKIPDHDFAINLLKEQLTIALDDVQDPGNLGTIIRLADWFGIQYVICSIGTVDAFSPKVIQATMGSITRVKVIYINLNEVLDETSRIGIPSYGTFMEGDNIFNTELPTNALVIMGNEGNGISQGVEKLINKRLTIPKYSGNIDTIESLNVATATAIVCAEFRRRITI